MELRMNNGNTVKNSYNMYSTSTLSCGETTSTFKQNDSTKELNGLESIVVLGHPVVKASLF